MKALDSFSANKHGPPNRRALPIAPVVIPAPTVFPLAACAQ